MHLKNLKVEMYVKSNRLVMLVFGYGYGNVGVLFLFTKKLPPLTVNIFIHYYTTVQKVLHSR